MSRLRRLDMGRLGILAVLVIAAAAFVTRDQWDWLLEDGSVRTQGVTADTIDDVDEETERLYRITSDSSVSYEVQERLAGSASTAVGTTSLVAGDIVVNTADPTASRIGEIVVNVESFHSGSNLRDKRIRLDFLESREYPFAVFTATSVEGLPASAVEGENYEVTVTGELSVKETTAPVVFVGTVAYDDLALVADMRTTILMSTYDVGPIHIAGLAHTEDEVELRFALVAERVDSGSDPDQPDTFVAAAPEVEEGSFASAVQPILESNCASCHTEGGPGWSTVRIDTAGEAAELAADIALVTEARYMPPWPAGDLSIPFRHDWSLSAEDRATISEWAGAGGGLDVPADTPLVARVPRLVEIPRDVVARTEPYSGSAEQVNDYRCRAIEVGDPSTERWIQGIQYAPDHLEVTHHGLLFTAPDSARGEIERADARDPEPGWPCFGLAGIQGSSLVSGWAPGAQPFVMPEGSGLRLAPGDLMILQIHYHFEDAAPPDAPSMVFDLADDAAIAAAGGSLAPLQYSIYLNPAEIPCTDAEAATGAPLCERSAVLEQIVDQYGSFAGRIPDGLLLQCGQSLGDFLDDTDGVVSSSCDHRVDNPGEVLMIWGHMHEFGSHYRMTLNPDTPEERILLDIPTWSFEWQLGYEPVEELVVDGDDVLRIECTWDRSLQFQPEPRYITWNEGTEDEMCWTSFATIPLRD